MKKVNVKRLVKLYNGLVSIEDFNKGSGVYRIKVKNVMVVDYKVDVEFVGGEDYEVRSDVESGVIEGIGSVEGKYESIDDFENYEYFNVKV